MNAQELRHELQSATDRWQSDITRNDLIEVLKRTREEKGGISLMEIAEVIKEALALEEVEQIKNNL